MKELMLIQSELKAPKGQTNAFGKYKYRSCEDILEAVKPLLKKHECTIVINDDLVMVGDRYYIKAISTITNKDNNSVSSVAFAREPLDQRGMSESQITGAASSYSRKYSLNGLLLIDDTKDADTMDNSKPIKPKKATKNLGELKTELGLLLKAANKYSPAASDAISSMSEKQLLGKIAEYKK